MEETIGKLCFERFELDFGGPHYNGQYESSDGILDPNQRNFVSITERRNCFFLFEPSHFHFHYSYLFFNDHINTKLLFYGI